VTTRIEDVVLAIALVSLTGALAPGPLTVATIICGASRGARAGLLVSIGHTIVELPYVLALVLIASQEVVRRYVELFSVRIALGLLALAFVLYFSYIAFKEGRKLAREGCLQLSESKFARVLANPLSVGILLAGLNPPFLAWWVVVGGPLLLRVAPLGLLKHFPLLYAAHVWIDYVWLTLLAYLSRRGLQIFGKKYGYVLEVLAIVLAVLTTYLVIKLFFTQ